MRRGTTPTNTFTTDIDLREADIVWLTYKQGKNILFTKEKSDLNITETEVSLTLTQEDTLAFNSHETVTMQIRARFSDGSAIASNEIKTSVADILKDGVI